MLCKSTVCQVLMQTFKGFYIGVIKINGIKKRYHITGGCDIVIFFKVLAKSYVCSTLVFTWWLLFAYFSSYRLQRLLSSRAISLILLFSAVSVSPLLDERNSNISLFMRLQFPFANIQFLLLYTTLFHIKKPTVLWQVGVRE